MLKKFFYCGTLAMTSLLMSSCFGDEPKNMECDIESIAINLENPTDIFYWDYNSKKTVKLDDGFDDIFYTTDSIPFIVRYDAVIGELPVTVGATEGATVYLSQNNEYVPFRNGSLVDFSGEQTRLFRIVSEDGVYNRTYKVCVVPDEDPNLGACTMKIDFEDFYYYEEKGLPKYHIFIENDPYAISADQWVSGNPGFKLSKSSAQPDDYPTVAVEGGGVDGNTCLKLETRDTGAFGRMVNYRIAAGNLFIGTFDVANALKNALQATRFGLPFRHKPIKMSGYYKFKAGPQFQDKRGNPVDRIDQPDAYCVMYRAVDAQGNRVQPDGDDVLTNPNIVGIGRITGVVETNDWTRFEIPIEYSEDIDQELLIANGYNMTVCFSSSIEGAYFEGAPESTFYVDKVTLECEY